MYYQKITDPTVSPTHTDDYITDLGILMYVNTSKQQGWATHNSDGVMQVVHTLQPKWWLKKVNPFDINYVDRNISKVTLLKFNEKESIENIIKLSEQI
jgi:hypothetical protein